MGLLIISLVKIDSTFLGIITKSFAQLSYCNGLMSYVQLILWMYLFNRSSNILPCFVTVRPTGF